MAKIIVNPTQVRDHQSYLVKFNATQVPVQSSEKSFLLGFGMAGLNMELQCIFGLASETF